MKKVTFYIMQDPKNDVEASMPLHHELACKLAGEFYQQGQRVYIHTNDESAANQVDEYLWQLDASSFVPHNLQGEGPRNGAPVEIGFNHLAIAIRYSSTYTTRHHNLLSTLIRLSILYRIKTV